MKSNCLFEALKAKMRDPKNVRIHIIRHLMSDSVWSHFWWEKDNKAFNFVSRKPRRFQVFLFEGDIQETSLSYYLELQALCEGNYLQNRKKCETESI